MRTCTVEGCDRKHQARGLCVSHWSKWYRETHPERNRASETVTRTCVVCAETWQTRRKNAKICSDTCRSEWYRSQRIGRQQTKCELPADHPVRVLIRNHHQQCGPLRAAFESGDWPGVLAALEVRAVKVDECWLWPSKSTDGYGVVRIAKRTFSVHRLAASASMGEAIPSHKPVHHKCAEPLCFNPLHLQVVQPHENTAEMLERRYYKQRIADLEAALAVADPAHPLLPSRLHAVA